MTDDCCNQISNWTHGECARCGNHCMPKQLWAEFSKLQETKKTKESQVSNFRKRENPRG